MGDEMDMEIGFRTWGGMGWVEDTDLVSQMC